MAFFSAIIASLARAFSWMSLFCISSLCWASRLFCSSYCFLSSYWALFCCNSLYLFSSLSLSFYSFCLFFSRISSYLLSFSMSCSISFCCLCLIFSSYCISLSIIELLPLVGLPCDFLLELDTFEPILFLIYRPRLCSDIFMKYSGSSSLVVGTYHKPCSSSWMILCLSILT